MILNDIQIDILKEIHEYMNKEIHDGVIIEFEDYTKPEIVKDINYSSWATHYVTNIGTHDVEDSSKLKVFGHYDISALTKYIHSLGYYNLAGSDIGDNFYFGLNGKELNHEWQMDGKFFTIPYKPLYLYSEKENELVLKLLKQLKNI